jgi:glycosyltransferase 2 family protein
MHENRQSFNVPLKDRDKRFPVRVILALAVTLALGLALARAPWADVGRALAAAQPGWLAAAVLINAAIYPFWVAQWRLLVAPPQTVAWPAMAEIVALSEIARSTFAAPVGVAAAITLLTVRGGLSATAATAVMALDQLFAGLAKVVTFALAALLAPLPQAAMVGVSVFCALVLALLVVVLILAATRGLPTALGRSSSPLVQRAGVLLQGFSENLRVMRSPTTVGMVFALAIIKRGTQVAAVCAVQAACGIDISLPGALLIVAAVSLTTAIPLTPGGIGVYSATVFATYSFLGVASGPAIAAGVLQHLVELLPSLAVGYGALLLDRLPGRARARAARQGLQ